MKTRPTDHDERAISRPAKQGSRETDASGAITTDSGALRYQSATARQDDAFEAAGSRPRRPWPLEGELERSRRGGTITGTDLFALLDLGSVDYARPMHCESTLEGHDGGILAVAALADGRVVTASEDESAKI